MTTSFRPTRTLAVLIAVSCFASCGRESVPASRLPTGAAPDRGIAFVSGFHREETLTPTAILRWAGQDAVMRVDAPVDGRYRITFRAFTAFSMEENTIRVRVNGEPAGKFSTRAFALDDVVPTPVEVTLRAGSNDLALQSNQPLARLGEDDERVAAFGLLLPVVVEPVP